uniref:XPG N-terminal domain-containing protein n=1 Tax=viral metagenome TaxID=1070528 RepID=A0A6C0L878_9ZZZZ
MGIKNLNRFLRDNCSKKAITKKHLSYFKNKTVVIDTSIYLYKFASEGSLMESMYLFISVLKSYRITPLFIFDGKPPPEKNELLRQRKLEKKDAEQKYYSLQAKLQTINDNEESKEIIQEMDNLKRQMVKIRDEDIKNVKRLMDAYGVIYYDAPGEADRLCAYLLKNGKAWGCISDDMDMFLYGCKYVIRNVSLMNHTAIYYDTEKILSELDMTENRFCEIMVLSGTDYNINSNTCLNETIKWYYEYMKYANNVNNPYGFYIWLLKNTKYITDYSRLINTYRIFQLNNNTDLENWDNIDVTEKELNNVLLKEIMGKEGFVFAN